MAILRVEKLGGLANFGGSRSRLRSRGQFDTSSLSQSDLETLEALFRKPKRAFPRGAADLFRFRISRDTEAGEETIEVSEAHVPPAIASCVEDELV